MKLLILNGPNLNLLEGGSLKSTATGILGILVELKQHFRDIGSGIFNPTQKES